MTQDILQFALNRGIVSTLASVRTDQEPLRLAAERQTNWLPRVLGPMMLRPGLGFVGEVFNSQPTKMISFVASLSDMALIELTDHKMRVWSYDAETDTVSLVSRVSVGTVIPPFSLWTLSTSGTATAAVVGSALQFANVNFGAQAAASIRVVVAVGDTSKEHGLRITVDNGPVTIRIGTALGLDDVFGVQTLTKGTYSLSFTPAATAVWVQFSSIIAASTENTVTKTLPQGLQMVSVGSCSIEAPGVMELPAPWAADVIRGPSLIRSTSSADVTYVACIGYPQFQINHYPPNGWAIVNYIPVKGPMPGGQGDPSVAIAPSWYWGNIDLTATRPIFKPQDVGTLFRLFHNSQTIIDTLSFPEAYSDCVRIAGVSQVSTVSGGTVVNHDVPDRNFNYEISGTWTGTLSIERSFEGPTSGFTVYATKNSNIGPTLIQDGLNNQIIWYRIGFKQGDYGSGEATIHFAYNGGGGYGIAKVTEYVDPQLVHAEVLVPFYAGSNASDWRQSEWSDYEGWPTSVALHEGRLWWAGSDRWWGSVSDDYNNFDYDKTGDSSPIDESIGQGPISNINWLLSLDHLLAGADTSIIMARSEAIDSPLTAQNFNLRQSMTNGAAPLQALRMDSFGFYVDQSGRRIYRLTYDIQNYNYKPEDVTKLNPDIGSGNFYDNAVQRQPDTRFHYVRGDGTVVCLVYDVEDAVQAFWLLQTDGSVENVVVLPGRIENQVYYVVARQVGGVTRRYLERAARIDECQGRQITRLADSHIVYNGAPTTSMGGLNHLIGREVVVWADGRDIGTRTVDLTGRIYFGTTYYSQIVAGLVYQADFISMKLAYDGKRGTAINKVKRVSEIGFVLENTHYQGIQYGPYISNPILAGSGPAPDFGPDFGPDFDTANTPSVLWDTSAQLSDMPLVEFGMTVPPDTVWSSYDQQVMTFPGDLQTDPRIRLLARAPRPATVLGITFTIETS